MEPSLSLVGTVTLLSKLKLIWLAALLAGVAYAGSGANGGQGDDTESFTYDLVYGTISPSLGSPIDFVATTADVTIFLEDFTAGGDSGIPSIVENGAAGLLALSPTGPFEVTFPQSGGGSPISFTADFIYTVADDIWFSNGTVGEIDPSDISVPSAILAAAESLGGLSDGPFVTSSSSEGSVSFSNVFSQSDPEISGNLDDTVNLEQLDFSTPVTATPEPSLFWVGLIALVVMAGVRAVRRNPGPRLHLNVVGTSKETTPVAKPRSIPEAVKL
jgi:hypothetical protein